MSKYLGDVSAYAYAVSKGYTGTEKEFAELIASYATVAEEAAESAEEASASATEAGGYAETASTKAGEAADSAIAAAGSAGIASTKAAEAAQSATDASGSASTASTKAGEASASATAAAGSAGTASTKAGEASQSATDANTAKVAAQTAQSAAETAQGHAEDAQEAAEEAAESVSEAAAQIAQNTADISELKSEITHNLYGDNLMGMELGVLYPVFLKSGTVITVSTSDGSKAASGHGTQIRLYAADKTMIDYYTAPSNGQSTRAITVPADTYYLDWNKIYPVPLMVNVGSAALSYAPYFPSVKRINDEIAGIDTSISSINGNISGINGDISKIENALSPAFTAMTGTTTSGKYIRGSDGAVSDITGVGWAVDSFTVSPGKKYKITARAYSGNYYFAFYTSADAFISGTKATESGTTGIDNVIATAPGTAAKLVVCSNTSNQAAEEQSGYIVPKKWEGKKWTVFGDSLTEVNVRTTKHYFDYVADATGISIYNMGNGGSGYASERGDNTAFYQRIGNVPLDSDVITIFGSFNDLSEIGTGSGQIPLGDADDSGTTTVGGLINATFDNLFTAFPLANVGVVTPTPWVNANPLAEPNAASAYVDLIIAVCKRRGIPCLDLFHCSALRPWDSDFRDLAYSKDDGNGVHPDETGHKIMSSHFMAFLQKLISTY